MQKHLFISPRNGRNLLESRRLDERLQMLLVFYITITLGSSYSATTAHDNEYYWTMDLFQFCCVELLDLFEALHAQSMPSSESTAMFTLRHILFVLQIWLAFPI